MRRRPFATLLRNCRSLGNGLWESRSDLTDRRALDRLLDPDNTSVTLHTLQRTAVAVGRQLRLELI